MAKKLPADVAIKINRTVPEMDECRFIILKIIEQAVRDYLRLHKATSARDLLDYETAVDFIFEDDYHVPWGDVTLSLSDFLDILGLEVTWFRHRVLLARERKIETFSLHDEVAETEGHSDNE